MRGSREITDTPYDRIAEKWITRHVGFAPQYMAPYESLFLPKQDTYQHAMMREPYTPVEGMMVIDYYPQPIRNIAPNSQYNVVYLIDALHRLHYHTTRHSVEWLHEVRYKDGHMYMLVDIPDRYMADVPSDATLDFVAQWLMPSISMLRTPARHLNVMPYAYLLWNHVTNHWQQWEKSDVCRDIYQTRSEIAALSTEEGKKLRARRNKQQKREREKARLMAAKIYAQQDALFVKQVRLAMQKCHSADELKRAMALSSLRQLRRYDTLLQEIQQRYRLDSLSVPQLKEEPLEVLEELCTHYPDPLDLLRYHPKIYNFLTREQHIFRIYPNHHMLRSKEQRRMNPVHLKGAKRGYNESKYSVQDIWDAVDRCESYNQFRHDCPELYTSAKHRCLLGDIRHRFAERNQSKGEGLKDRIRYEAKKFPSWKEFKKNAPPELLETVMADDKLVKFTQNYIQRYRERMKLTTKQPTNPE